MATARDEVQTLTITATGETYTLTYSGQTTAALDWDATALEIRSALIALSNIPVNGVRVTGAGPFLIRGSGPAFRHTNLALITVNTGSLTGGSASIVETVAGQAGDKTGIRVTGRKGLVSVHGDGSGDTSTIMAGATSFTFFARLRIYAVADDQPILGLVTEADGAYANAVLAVAANPAGPNIGVFGWMQCTNGSTNEVVSVSLATVPDPTGGGYRDVLACFTGVVEGGRWKVRWYPNGQSQSSGTVDAPSGFGTFGKVGAPPLRFVMGAVANWPNAADSDIIYDDVYIWKNRVLSLSEIQNLTNGAFDVEFYYPDDLVVCIDGDGELGEAVAAQDPGVTNRAALDFDTAPANVVFTGTMVYGDPPVVTPAVPIEAVVMRSGKTIAFVMSAPGGATTFEPIGTQAQPYPGVTFHPSIRVNGGSPVTLANPQYIEINGPYFLTYSLTGPNGVLGSPIGVGDTVTFSVSQAWLRALVDGAASSTLPYADEPATVEAGTPYVMPEVRTMKFGNNLKVFKHKSGYAHECFTQWSGSGITLDADGQLQNVTGTAAISLNNIQQRSAGWGWSWDEDPDLKFSTPPLPPGRWCLTWDGTFNFNGASAGPDTIRDTGCTPSYGPWNNKRVSFCNITDIEAVPAAGAIPNLLYFTVAYETGNTGHAVGESTPGDDFVRPCPATGTYLQFNIRGPSASPAGLAGPRENLNLYHLGPVGEEYFDPADGLETIPEFDPALVSMLTQAGTHTLRFTFDCFSTFSDSPPSLDYVARWDAPQRWRSQWPEYPNGYTTAVLSVSNFAGDAALLGLKPPGYKGAFLVVETAAPHTLKAGAYFAVNGGNTYIPVADNGATAPQDVEYRATGIRWDTEYLCCLHVLTSTTFIIFQDTTRSLTADVVPSPNPATTGLGSISVVYHNAYILPDEAVRLAVTVGADTWVNMPVAFSDAEFTEIATRIASELDGNDTRVVFEFANELWNNGFRTSLYSRSQPGSLPGSGATFSATQSGGVITSGTVTAPGSGYFYGHDGWYLMTVGGGGTGAEIRAHFVNGVATSVQVVSGGTGYSSPTLALPANNSLWTTYGNGQFAWIAVQTWRLRKLVRAAFTAAGIDPDRARFAHAIQGFTISQAETSLGYWTRAGWTLENSFVSPTNYDNMGEVQRYYVSSAFDPYRWKTDDVDQNIDRNIGYYRWHPGRHADGQALRDWLDANGYSAIRLECYEGGVETVLESFDPYEARSSNITLASDPALIAAAIASATLWSEAFKASWEIVANPRYREIEGARAERCGAFLDVEISFMVGTDPDGASTYIEMWGKSFQIGMLAGKGDGSDGKFDNRIDPFAWNDIVSPVQAALGEWNGAVIADGLAVSAPTSDEMTTGGFYLIAGAPSGGVPGYALEVQRDISGTWTTVATGYGRTWFPASPGTAYTFRTRVTDGAANVAPSASAVFTTPALSAGLGSPGGAAGLGIRRLRRATAF